MRFGYPILKTYFRRQRLKHACRGPSQDTLIDASQPGMLLSFTIATLLSIQQTFDRLSSDFIRVGALSDATALGFGRLFRNACVPIWMSP